ncbi:MAG TPA: hypothetical protein VNO43_13855 [Candidatus Eisenbacteria bacterium]|nr:hypothetical protein [Candidatus Eisenbacteria bacterium]
MMNFKRQGMRCRAKRVIRSPGGLIPAHSEGKIAHEIENLGRRLILVSWDANGSTYVFADEIEILNGDVEKSGGLNGGFEQCA